MINREFRRRGHTLDWFAASFNHFTKCHRTHPEQTVEIEPGYRIHLLESPGYPRNVSFARLRDHAALSNSFRQRIPTVPPPDLIVCSYPTIELAGDAVAYGRKHGVPVVLDVRDLWPDSFLDAFPPSLHGILRPCLRLALYPLYRKAAIAFRHADVVTGNTETMVRWARRLARRPLSPDDAGLYMAYPEPEAGTKDAEADAYWDAMGVRRDAWRMIACFFGTFYSNYRDVPDVIRAFRQPGMQEAGLACVLCGRGDSLEACRAMAEGAPNIFLPGWVDAPRIRSLMQRSHVGLAPYRNCLNFCSSIPNKPPEYFSAGLPVLSSLDGELRTLLERNEVGIHYPSGKPEALAGCLLDLAGNPERHAAMARNARELFVREFTAGKVYGDWVVGMERYVAGYAAQGGKRG